jgi:L-rhamnose mutarotase
MTVDNISSLTSLPESTVMKKWWAYMKDIMVTNDDASPVSIPLKQVFFME